MGAAAGGALAHALTRDKTDSGEMKRKAAVAGGIGATSGAITAGVNISGNRASKARWIAAGKDPAKFRRYICPTGGASATVAGAGLAAGLVAANKARQIDREKVKKNSEIPLMIRNKRMFKIPEMGMGALEGTAAGGLLGMAYGATKSPEQTGESRKNSAKKYGARGAGVGAVGVAALRAKGAEPARKRLEEYYRSQAVRKVQL